MRGGRAVDRRELVVARRRRAPDEPRVEAEAGEVAGQRHGPKRRLADVQARDRHEHPGVAHGWTIDLVGTPL